MVDSTNLDDFLDVMGIEPMSETLARPVETVHALDSFSIKIISKILLKIKK